jgi:hypothetical protein
VLKSSLGLGPIRHFTETRVRGHIAICVLAAVIEQLIGNRLRDADLRDPDLEQQHLSAERAIQELDRIRQVTFTAGDRTTPSPAAAPCNTRSWLPSGSTPPPGPGRPSPADRRPPPRPYTTTCCGCSDTTDTFPKNPLTSQNAIVVSNSGLW